MSTPTTTPLLPVASRPALRNPFDWLNAGVNERRRWRGRRLLAFSLLVPFLILCATRSDAQTVYEIKAPDENPANGTITPLGTTRVNEGGELNYVIQPDQTPAPGYALDQILVDGSPVEPTSSSPPVYNYTFSNVQSDHSISASFKKVPDTTVVTMTMSDKSGLDPDQYSIYVLGFTQTSQKFLQQDAGDSSTLTWQVVPDLSTGGNILSYKVGTGKNEVNKIQIIINRVDPDSAALTGARIYYFVADNNTFPDAPTLYYGKNFAVSGITNPPHATMQVGENQSKPCPPYVYSELTVNEKSELYIDLSAVDSFNFSSTLQIDDTTGLDTYALVGQPLDNDALSRSSIIAGFSKFLENLKAAGADDNVDDFNDLIYKDYGGRVILNPGLFLSKTEGYGTSVGPQYFPNATSPLNTYYDEALGTLFSKDGAAQLSIISDDVTGLTATYTGTYVTDKVHPDAMLAHPAIEFTAVDQTGIDPFYVFDPVGFAVMNYQDPSTKDAKVIYGKCDSNGNMTFCDSTGTATPLPSGTLQKSLYISGGGMPSGKYEPGSPGTPSSPWISSLTTNDSGDIVSAEMTYIDKDGATTVYTDGKTTAFPYYFCKAIMSTYFFSSGAMVFDNSGLLSDDNYETDPNRQKLLASIERDIATALVRGVAVNVPKSSSTSDGHSTIHWEHETNWYPAGQPQSLYSLYMHTYTIGGSDKPIYSRPPNPEKCARGTTMAMCYGFGYDENPGKGGVQSPAQVPTEWGPVPTAYMQDNTTVGMTFTFGAWESAVTQYTITPTTGANGSISPKDPVKVTSGDSQTFTFNPDKGYQVDKVEVDGVAQEGTPTSYTFSDVKADHAISVSFKAIPADKYVITVSSVTNGSIKPSGEVTVDSGGSQTFAITADAGYKIDDVTVDGASKGAVSSYTFSNVTANHTIGATFAKVSTSHTITATAGDNGKISPSGAVSVPAGADQSFTITANSGYQIDDVQVDGKSVGTPISYKFSSVSTDHTITASFKVIPADTYVIKATAGSNGSISPSGEVTVASGADQSFTITPDSGYQIDDVQVDGKSKGAVDSYAFTAVSAKHTINATFEVIPPTKYTIAVTVGENGSITPSGNVSVTAGADQSFAIAANSGYQIDDVQVDGASVGTPTSYKFSAVSANHTISATFKAIPPTTYVINSTAGSGGSISPSGEVSVTSGADQAFTITADANYQISDVKVDDVSQGAVGTYTFSAVTSAHRISASFTPITYDIAATAGEHGQISPSGTVQADAGQDQTFAITADSNYQIDDVQVDGASVGTPTSYTFKAVEKTHTIAATFKEIPPASYVIKATAGSNGSISPSGEVSVTSGADQTFAIAADSGYEIDDVLVDGASQGAVTSYTFSVVGAHHTITATFKALPVYHTITVTYGEHGEITPGGSVSVEDGTNQTCAIDPDSGYQVADVTVDGASVGAVSSYTFDDVTTDHAISAIFDVRGSHTVTFTAAAGGSISGETVQYVAPGGDCATVTAVPDDSFYFNDWTGTDNFRSTDQALTVTNVTQDMEITAYFASEPVFHVAPGSVFKMTVVTALEKRPKVLCAVDGKDSKVKVMTSAKDFKAGLTSFYCEWHDQRVFPGQYSLYINGERYTSYFYVEQPVLTSMDPDSGSGAEETPVVVLGKFFGYKKPRVYMYIESIDKTVRCKLGKPSYPDAKDKPGKSYMDVDTGDSRLDFTAPRKLDVGDPAELTIEFKFAEPIVEPFNQ